MSKELKKNDYIKILNYYKIHVPKSYKKLKIEAEKILSQKLCRCIKKVDIKNEAKSIGICTKTVLNNKGLTRGKFKCKGKRTITIKKK
jgi:hypothetical protein